VGGTSDERSAEIRNSCGLHALVAEPKQGGLPAYSLFEGAEALGLSRGIKPGHELGQVEYGGVASEAELEGEVVGGIVFVRKTADALGSCLPEAVDALIVVPGHEDFRAPHLKRTNDRLIARIQVLVLVDQQVFDGGFEVELGNLPKRPLQLVDELVSERIAVEITMIAPCANERRVRSIVAGVCSLSLPVG